MDERTFLLLQFLAAQKSAIRLDEKTLPVEIRTLFTFTFQKYDTDDFYHLLLKLKGKGLLDSESGKWKIIQGGRFLLENEIKLREGKDEVSKLKFEELKLNVEELRSKFFDYAKVKSNAKWSIRLSAIAIGVTLLLGLLQLICTRQS